MIKIILFCFICLIIGSLLGYSVGFTAGLGWAYDKALILLDKQGIVIEFDEQMIATGLWQYHNNVGGCLFVDNINKTDGN